MKHITCLAHALHRVCETIRDMYPVANEFISAFKMVLRKSPSRINIYKESTNLPLPTFPIVTRWGTWLDSVGFISKNFEKLSEFLFSLTEKKHAIVKSQELINKG